MLNIEKYEQKANEICRVFNSVGCPFSISYIEDNKIGEQLMCIRFFGEPIEFPMNEDENKSEEKSLKFILRIITSYGVDDYDFNDFWRGVKNRVEEKLKEKYGDSDE